mmetsp:Transcript_21689/g.56622  ORF Transcript_21689/g.56622 Transcript_21689/m.56622 type:complete len:176 (+) Transcript_21689:1004-1531(+)
MALFCRYQRMKVHRALGNGESTVECPLHVMAVTPPLLPLMIRIVHRLGDHLEKGSESVSIAMPTSATEIVTAIAEALETEVGVMMENVVTTTMVGVVDVITTTAEVVSRGEAILRTNDVPVVVVMKETMIEPQRGFDGSIAHPALGIYFGQQRLGMLGCATPPQRSSSIFAIYSV